jgi:hypothetical protein
MTEIFPVNFNLNEFPTWSPEAAVFPVIATPLEKSPTVGLRCEFCLRLFSWDVAGNNFPVKQVFVTKTGKEQGRWGGGDPVWQCKICEGLGRMVTKSGQVKVLPKVPEATVADVKQRIGNTVFSKVQSIKW